LEEVRVVENVIQARGSLERGDLAEQLLAGACSRNSLENDLLTCVGQRADLQSGGQDGDEQRHRDQPPAQEPQATQRLGSSPIHHGSLASRLSHSSEVFTMVSRLSRRGCQPNTVRTLFARATRMGGSPARRGSSRIVSGWPATRSTLFSTSRTLYPWPYPPFSTCESPPFRR